MRTRTLSLASLALIVLVTGIAGVIVAVGDATVAAVAVRAEAIGSLAESTGSGGYAKKDLVHRVFGNN